ncbi:TetR family transcriptional regulator [Leptospira yanagawae]|uniref:TetR family transcriptional regulator n=1 Tax=Leptospira yanagawae TaxID=293069 RepID=A0ABY2M3I9_9LEPT|nr:TetR family transcriptional regulator [Leptospira yanagawae]
MVTKKKDQKKRKTLSKDLLIQTAIQYANRNGIDALSMRNLANSLGVEAMSLYNHIQNKEELLDGMVEDSVKHFYKPKQEKDWKKEFKKRANSVREVLLNFPWLTVLLVARVNVGEHMLKYFDQSLACLVGVGFTYKQADHIINAVDSHIYGFTLQELNFPFSPDEYASKAKEYLPMINAEHLPYFFHLSMEVANGKYDGIHHFEFGLDLILNGLNPNPKKRN